MKLSIQSISHNIALVYDLFTNRRYGKIEPLSIKSYRSVISVSSVSVYTDSICNYSFYNNNVADRLSYIIFRERINLKDPSTSIFKRNTRIRIYGIGDY